MYQVKETEYGLYLKITGSVSLEDSKTVLSELRQIFHKRESGICGLADLHEMELLSAETQAVCVEIQQMCIKFGVKRIAVILGNSAVAYQFKRLSLQSGIRDYERYLDASSDPDWEEKAMAWVIDGTDPEAEWREEIARKRAELADQLGD